MESDAYEFLCLQIDLNKDKVLWICKICSRNLDVSRRSDMEATVMCECCFKWFHFECLSLRETIDESISYFCNVCLKK